MSEKSNNPRTYFRAQIEKAIKRDPHQGKETIGDLIRAIMTIENAEDAKRFYDGYVLDIASKWPTEDASTVAQANIGWCFGEGMSSERQQMWITVCNASHPVFGQTMPTAGDALAAGLALGENAPREP